jgi:DNA invertase Pin-like site-specific DNA recombinase
MPEFPERSRRKYAAAYLRTAADRTGRSIQAQERLARTYAAEAWPGDQLVLFIDDCVPAWNGLLRPAFDELCAALRRREVLGVWAAGLDRVTRQDEEWFRFCDELRAAGLDCLHTADGPLSADGLGLFEYQCTKGRR